MKYHTPFMAALIAATLHTPVQAATIDQSTADSISGTLTKYLPKDVIDTGFIKVTAGANRYELAVDIQALIDHYKPQDFTVSGLKPFIHFLTPQENGLWRVEANQSLDMTASVGKGDQKVDFTYKIENMMFDSMFDPSISYFTEGKWDAASFAIDSRGNGETMRMTGGAIEQVLSTRKLSDTHVTMTTAGTMAGLTQTVSSGAAGDFTFKSGKIGFDAAFENFGIGPFRDLVIFGLDHISKDKLTPEEGETLRSILKANLPFGDLLKEKVTVSDIAIEAQGMKGSVAEVTYAFDFNGLRRDSRFGVDFTARNPVIPAGLLPPGSEQALPETIGLGFALTNMNLADAANYFLDHADLSADEPLTPTEGTEIERIIFPGGQMHIEFRNVFARSQHYDVEMSGLILGNANDSNRFSADMTILARNLDGTIEFLQKNAAAVPVFGQAAFGAQMIKGFAKQEADGRFSWNIKVDETGKMKVNGQDFPIQ